jgi:hypothetical protein
MSFSVKGLMIICFVKNKHTTAFIELCSVSVCVCVCVWYCNSELLTQGLVSISQVL